LGFDFMCDNWQALLDAASRAKGSGQISSTCPEETTGTMTLEFRF
jgi:hypothetical protein